MRQVKAFGPRDLRVVEEPAPLPQSGEVIVEVQACGICGSDKWFWQVESPSDYVAGHEAAGCVVDVGPDVTSLKIGDRVAVNNVKGCGVCVECLAGRFVRCSGPLDHMGFGFAERMAVPERNCLLLNDNLSYEEGSLLFDNWGTPYAALKRTEMKAGDQVIVTGCGPIGLAAVALCVSRGARVSAVDPLPARREAALRLGASFAVGPGKVAGQLLIDANNKDSFHYVIECSGHASSYELAFQTLQVEGTIVAIGEGARFPFNSSQLIHKHLTLLGSLYSSMEDGAELQAMAVRGELNPLAFVTHRFRLSELPQNFGLVMGEDPDLLKAVVLRD